VTDLARDLDSLVPPFDDSDANWQDALRRSGRRGKWPAALLAATLVAAALTAASFGTAVGGDAFDRLTAWVSGAPGDPAPEEELRALREANARSVAPIPADTELGLLATKRINGVDFELLGFRDRASLCLRLRNSAGQESRIVKAPASCVSEELLVDLGKPLAVVAAADPFPRTARRGLQALYGLAADRAAVVELEAEGGARRVAVQNNAFLFVYEGESPRLTDNRLDYQSDVPSRATALDASGGVLGSVRIMSLRRGYPGGPSSGELPGPHAVERSIDSPRVGWLDRREERGEPFAWPAAGLKHLRIFRPNPATSMRVAVGLGAMGLSGRPEPVYCLTNVWPLQPRPTGMICDPVGGRSGTFTSASASTMFDAQFPVHYGLVPDGVASLELVLANGKHSTVPLTNNVFAFQTSSAQSAKLVGYDEDGRVALIRVIPPTP
jgi:hypothetical protein